MTDTGHLMPGAVYYLGRGCGVPWTFRPIYYRLIRVRDGSNWNGMAYLDGYELGDGGDALERRVAYVIVAGLQLIRPSAAAAPVRRSYNRPPVPAQRRPLTPVRSTLR